MGRLNCRHILGIWNGGSSWRQWVDNYPVVLFVSCDSLFSMLYECRSIKGERGARCGGLAVGFAVDNRALHGHICRSCFRSLPREQRNLYSVDSVEVKLADLRAMIAVDLSTVRQLSVPRVYSAPDVQMEPVAWQQLVWDLGGLIPNSHYSKYYTYLNAREPGPGIGTALDDERLRLQPGFTATMWVNWQNWRAAALAVDRGQAPVCGLSDVELAAAKAWQRTVVAHQHALKLRELAIAAELKNSARGVSVVVADLELELANYRTVS